MSLWARIELVSKVLHGVIHLRSEMGDCCMCCWVECMRGVRVVWGRSVRGAAGEGEVGAFSFAGVMRAGV